MQRPLCKLCATRHWSREGCPATKETVRESVEHLRSKASLPPLPAVAITEPVVVEAAQPFERVAPPQTTPMTVAERSKRYREKDPEGYRKANAARMRRKRGG